MATARGASTTSGTNDLIHAWVMDRPFSTDAWQKLSEAARGLMARGIRFGAAPRESLRHAPLLFTIVCAADTITLRGAGFMTLATHRVWLGGEELLIHRDPVTRLGSVNTAGRPYEPVVRALLAMAAHFGAGFRIVSTGSDPLSWHETDCLVSLLLGTDVCGIDPDCVVFPIRKRTPSAGPAGAWAVPTIWMRRRPQQSLAGA